MDGKTAKGVRMSLAGALYQRVYDEKTGEPHIYVQLQDGFVCSDDQFRELLNVREVELVWDREVIETKE